MVLDGEQTVVVFSIECLLKVRLHKVTFIQIARSIWGELRKPWDKIVGHLALLGDHFCHGCSEVPIPVC